MGLITFTAQYNQIENLYNFLVKIPSRFRTIHVSLNASVSSKGKQ